MLKPEMKIESIEITVKMAVGERIFAKTERLPAEVYDSVGNTGEVVDAMIFSLRRQVRVDEAALSVRKA